MKRRHHFAATLLTALGFSLATAASARATVLTFEVTPINASGQILNSTYAAYGDAVSSATAPGPGGVTFHYGDPNTPNLEVAYSNAGGFNHVIQKIAGPWGDEVDQLSGSNGNKFYIDFTSPSGYAAD